MNVTGNQQESFSKRPGIELSKEEEKSVCRAKPVPTGNKGFSNQGSSKTLKGEPKKN